MATTEQYMDGLLRALTEAPGRRDSVRYEVVDRGVQLTFINAETHDEVITLTFGPDAWERMDRTVRSLLQLWAQGMRSKKP